MADTYYQDPTVTLHHGDCLDVLRELPDCSVDSVVTDPPYGLEFMGKDWDAPWKASSVGRGARVATERAAELTPRGKGHTTSGGAYLAAGVDSVRVAGRPFQDWCEAWARECRRVLKPGGHMLAFGGTRTWHRLVVAVEDAGFEIRDSIAWLYGSGFPKSLDVSKAIDKAAGAEREVVGSKLDRPGYHLNGHDGGEAFGAGLSSSTYETRLASSQITAPATPEAQQWVGWGTALKPAFEPICVARKPLVGTVAGNVLAHGTGALNIDACRIAHDEPAGRPTVGQGGARSGGIMSDKRPDVRVRETTAASTTGRWPANVILDQSQAAELDQQSGSSQSRIGKPRGADAGDGWGMTATGAEYDDLGGASRFFYTAKAGVDERIRHDGIAHPTVKPLALMRWLVRLVTPPGGTVLEPFAGSGTTVEACVLEGFRCIAIEREADYLPLITQRINRRRDPVAYLTAATEDLGLFGD